MIRAARPFILIFGLFGLWWLASILVESLTGKGRFLLPSPDLVWAAFAENPDYFLKGFRVTLIEVALGLGIGAALGLWLTLVLAAAPAGDFTGDPGLCACAFAGAVAGLGARAQGRHDHADPVLSRNNGLLERL